MHTRHFVLTLDGGIREFTAEQAALVAAGSEPLPEFADRRVRYLQTRIPDLKVAGQKPADPGRVYFGAEVEVAGPDGEEKRFRIVGPDETDAAQGRISIDSPLARALLNHEVGDVVLARLPAGPAEYEILSVRYP